MFCVTMWGVVGRRFIGSRFWVFWRLKFLENFCKICLLFPIGCAMIRSSRKGSK